MNRHDEQFEIDTELAALHAALRRVMPIEAPAELVARLRVLTGALDPELESHLRGELPVDAPAELIARVTAACGVADVELDAAVRSALRVAAPAGLADRIHAATVDRIAPLHEPAVIASIGFSAVWRGAIAAAVFAAITLGLYRFSIDPTPPRQAPTVAAATLPTLDEHIALFERALDEQGETDALDARIVAVEAEVESVAFAMVFGADRDTLSDDGAAIERELNLIEARMQF